MKISLKSTRNLTQPRPLSLSLSLPFSLSLSLSLSTPDFNPVKVIRVSFLTLQKDTAVINWPTIQCTILFSVLKMQRSEATLTRLFNYINELRENRISRELHLSKTDNGQGKSGAKLNSRHVNYRASA